MTQVFVELHDSPSGQSVMCRHWTHTPAPLHSMPPPSVAHAVPFCASAALQAPASHETVTHALEGGGQSVSVWQPPCPPVPPCPPDPPWPPGPEALVVVFVACALLDAPPPPAPAPPVAQPTTAGAAAQSSHPQRRTRDALIGR
jgi:hypothetical protein